MKKEYILRYSTDDGELSATVKAETDNEAIDRARNMIRVLRNQGVATFTTWELDKVITETFHRKDRYQW